MWLKQDPNTLRLDAIGDVAAPFTRRELDESLIPFSRFIAEGKLPALVLLVPIMSALRGGRSQHRSCVAVTSINTQINALAACLVFDATTEAGRAAVHSAIRALSLVGIDAIEDMLAFSPMVRPMLEAERMHRHDMLGADWSIEHVPNPSQDGRVHVNIKIHLKPPSTEA